ncbi:hypothetical protein H0H81_009554 [Sphagnurus paluster]|uniref:Uncharacterized protein n=1 Tax=Sphagnurus paluster TaxID=117069 RepID=A0A9P7FTH9_9AGAR|nr:hypothetical protein H0H81_009554 [Sphagnurus paluster]
MRHAAAAVLKQFLSSRHRRTSQIRTVMNYYQPNKERDYIPLADHALIGNLRTAALVSLDGSIESYCVPNFDSPSIFARILDKDKGGHFSITPTVPFSVKQNYLPSSNVLQTKFMNDQGVASVTDFLPRPTSSTSVAIPNKPLLPWLIRRVECIRGTIPLLMQCAPAFNYARDTHTTELVLDTSIPPTHDTEPGTEPQKKIVFTSSSDFVIDLRYIAESTGEAASVPVVELGTLDLTSKGHKGLAAYASLLLTEGQAVTFVLRTPPDEKAIVVSPSNVDTTPKIRPLGGPVRSTQDPFLTKELLHSLLSITNKYWYDWIRQSTYTGSWKEAVHRSALALKLLIFEPTGAVVASPTFSLPEFIGGTRTIASWIRDSSFTLYALIRLGFTQEANGTPSHLIPHNLAKLNNTPSVHGVHLRAPAQQEPRRQSANHVYHPWCVPPAVSVSVPVSCALLTKNAGGKDLEEIELTHLDGHKGSKPVRIGNGAADHIQLFGKPLVSRFLSRFKVG